MEARFRKLFSSVILISASALWIFGCDKPEFDPTTPEGKQAIIEMTNKYLSVGDCAGAIREIESLYKSGSTDNEVRMIASSAYACKANINFFKLIGDLASNSAYMGDKPFWSLMAKLFPSTLDPDDRAAEGALLATDALLSVIKPGAVILPGNYINEKTNNPGAAIASDREDNANIYLLFVNMATIGAFENRYGEPDSTTHIKTKLLPWIVADHPDMPGNGCAFASAIVQMADNLGAVVDNINGNVKQSIDDLKTFVQNSIYDGCNAICVAKGSSCPRCPIKLRDRSQCTGIADDMPSEVAAGLTIFVNNQWTMAVP